MGNIIDSRVQTDAKDFAGIKQAFFEYAQNEFPEIWTDFNADQFMVLISDLLAYLGDQLTFCIDKQTAETFLTTATIRQSVIDLGIMLDYQLRSPSPASGSVTFTLDPTTFVYTNPIPKGFRISNSGALIYETTIETFATPGATSVTIPVLEGETKFETSSGDGPVGQSDGTPNQEFSLENSNLILSNDEVNLISDLVVTVGAVQYTPKFTLVTAQSTDKVYSVRTDDNGVTTIKFGNGETGEIPPTGVDVEATYRVLKDERSDNNFGNINASAVNTLEDTLTGVTAVTNSAAMTGGRDQESIEEARINIPRSLKAGDRAVSFDDYIILAEQFPGVAKAVALPGQGDCELDVDLYLAPDGGGFPSQQLKNDIIVHFDSRKMAKTKVFPRDPIYQPVSIDLRITAEGNNRNADIIAAVTSGLNTLFSFDNMDFGQGVFLKSTGGSDLFDINEVLESITGIASIKYNKISLKPTIYNKKFTNSGTPSLLNSCCSTRPTAERREMEVEMYNQTSFYLKNKIIGKSTSLNDTRLEDSLRTFLLEDGESTFVAATTLTDSSKYWLVNQYQNQTLIDSAGTSFEIASNTQDTLTLTSGTPAGGAYQIVQRLVGYYLNPNIDKSATFLITANDATSVTVASGLSTAAVITDSYEIFRYETNKFDADAHEGTETSGTATTSTFSDTTAIGFGDDFYNGFMLIFQDGPAANFPVDVIDYVSATGTFVTAPLPDAPVSGNRYVVAPRYILGKNATVSTIPAPTASAFSADELGGEGDDFYNGHVAHFTSGTNDGEVRKVIDYDDASNDTLTLNPYDNAPAAGDTFQLAKEYQTDDQSITFAVLAQSPSSSDVYVFQVSPLVGDLTPQLNQILELDSDMDLKLTVVGGS